jgi:hypothetical protein
MSNSIARVRFPNGDILYTVGDYSHFVIDSIHDTRDEAWDTYEKQREAWRNNDFKINFDAELFALAKLTEEPVICETTYGDGSWKEMPNQNCRASRAVHLITVSPHQDTDYSYDW